MQATLASGVLPGNEPLAPTGTWTPSEAPPAAKDYGQTLAEESKAPPGSEAGPLEAKSAAPAANYYGETRAEESKAPAVFEGQSTEDKSAAPAVSPPEEEFRIGSPDPFLSRKEILPSSPGTLQTHHGLGGTGNAPQHDASFVMDAGGQTRSDGSTLHPPGYEVLGELGRGGMGVVYKARQVKVNRLVALKMILHRGHASLEQQIRFQIEAEAIARFKHANIVQLHDVGEHDGMPFFSMEYCDGGSLDKELKGNSLPPRDAAALVEKLARATHYAHSCGVVHRDLKPGNVLLTSDGEPKITDFGLAKRLDFEQDVSRTGVILGTPSYMAPEQAAGKVHDIGPTADVYALGAILYELLTGRPPFLSSSPFETVRMVLEEEPSPLTRINKKVPRDLETICLKCLRKEPAKRYLTAWELADRLRRYQDGKPIPDRPVSAFEHAVKWARRRPSLAGLMAALVLVTVLGVTGILWKYREAEDKRAAAEQAELLAENRRKDAVRAEALAKEETLRANNESDLKDIQLTRAEGLLFARNLAQAQTHWHEGNPTLARNLLDSCRWDFRHWEHAHLRHLFDETQVTLRGHSKQVLSVCFSPNGKRLASGSEDRSAKIWDAATGQVIHTLTGHVDSVTSVAFSPNGALIATASRDKTIKVWDAASGQELRTLRGHTNHVAHVCFSPNGRQLASGSNDNTARLWDAATGRELALLKGHGNAVSSVCFSPDGQRVASGSLDQTVIVWDRVTAKKLLTLRGPTDGISMVCFSPEGKRILGSSFDQTMRLWDAVTGKEIMVLKGAAEGVTGASFSPDGKRVAGSSLDQMIHVWDAATGQELFALRGHTDKVGCISFSPDGQRLASASDDLTVKLWDAATGQEPLTFRGHAFEVTSVCFRPDGRRVVSGSGDHMAKMWDSTTGAEMRSFKGHKLRVTGVAVSPDGLQIVSASLDKTVRVWDASTGKQLRVFQGHGDAVHAVCYCGPDGKCIISAGGKKDEEAEKFGPGDTTVRIWDADNGTELLALKGHTQAVTTVCCSRDGTRIASGSQDRTVIVWDAKTGEKLHTFQESGLHPECVCFSPDGVRLASGAGKTATVWDAATGQQLLVLQGHFDAVHSIAFSPDGKRIATASSDRTVRIWDATTGQELLILKGHIADVAGVCFSPDGGRLASASFDRTVKVWDSAAGKEVRVLTEGLAGSITGACFSPDGETIATISGVGTVKIWNTTTGQELHTLKGPRDEYSGISFSPDGKRIMVRNRQGQVRAWLIATRQETDAEMDAESTWRTAEAVSPSGTLRATVKDGKVFVERTADNRGPSESVFSRHLNDARIRSLWHREEAAQAERAGQWFAAAHHLGQWLFEAKEGFDELAVRRLRALTLLHAPKTEPLRSRMIARPPARAEATERALAGVYLALDWPPPAIPWWLSADAHARFLDALRNAEAQQFLGPGRR